MLSFDPAGEEMLPCRGNDLMKRSEYMLWLGVAAAAGSALGLVSDRKAPGQGALLGAAAGLAAGSVAAGFYHYVTRDAIPFYTHESLFYEDPDTL